MAIDRIVAEIKRQAAKRGQDFTLTVKPRGSEPIVAQRAKLHSGFLELEVDLYVLRCVPDSWKVGETVVSPPVEPEGKSEPSATRQHFVPFGAIDWVTPTWL